MSRGARAVSFGEATFCDSWDGRSAQQSVFVTDDHSALNNSQTRGSGRKRIRETDANRRREALLMTEIPFGLGNYVALVSIGYRDRVNVIQWMAKSRRS